MSHTKKSKVHVYLGVTLGLTLAVLAVSIASVTSLQGSVTPRYNCAKNPASRGSVWQNKKNTLDVNADGAVTQEDVNIVIATLNNNSEKALWKIRPKLQFPPYIDVDGDMKVAPIDALLISNYLKNCTPTAKDSKKMQGNPWHNEVLATDVDGDGSTGPRDAMIVMNEVNGANGTRTLDLSVPRQFNRIDVTNDGALSGADYMAVMAVLNGR